jgi:hypothetical protein
MTASPARPDERRSQYHEVECGSCGARVLAAKFSPAHTSVQWDAAAVQRCREFGSHRSAAPSEPPAPIERCESMRSSIGAAAADGRLPVAPPWPGGS